MKNMGQGPCAACPEPFTEVNGKDHTISVNLTLNCQSPIGEKEATLSNMTLGGWNFKADLNHICTETLAISRVEY